MTNRLVSVIILTYKHGSFLFDTIDSIIDQYYPNIEIVIAEDGDPLFNKEEVEGYIQAHAGENIKNVVFSINYRNVGTVKNINNAIKKSNGDYIKIIAGDDTYPDKKVFSKQIELLDLDSTVYLVVGNIVECDSELSRLYETGFSYEDYDLLCNADYLLKYVTKNKPQLLSTQAICYKKSFFDEFGLYDEQFRLIEDLPMAVSIITKKIGFNYLDYPCVNHRGDVGISSSEKHFEKRKLNYYRDLKTYFEIILRPYNNIIDKNYIEMRIKLYDFRIKYTEMENGVISRTKKILLIIKYLRPLFYYFIERKYL